MLDRRHLLTGVAALGAGLALDRRASAQARSRARTIPLIEERGRFLVEVGLAARDTYRFVLDTGASTHFISAALAWSLGLPQVDSRSIRSFGGRTVESVVALRQLRVGGVPVPDTRAVAWRPEAMEGHDGLVGYPILGRRARLDLVAGLLDLNAPAPGAGDLPVRAEVSESETVLIGGPAGAEGRFVFDTGSARCVVSRRYFARLRETEAFAAAQHVVRVTPGEAPRTVSYRLPEMRFGGLVLHEPTIVVADPEASSEMFRGVDALFGVGLMRGRAWTIDRAAGTLHASDA